MLMHKGSKETIQYQTCKSIYKQINQRSEGTFSLLGLRVWPVSVKTRRSPMPSLFQVSFLFTNVDAILSFYHYLFCLYLFLFCKKNSSSLSPTSIFANSLLIFLFSQLIDASSTISQIQLKWL